MKKRIFHIIIWAICLWGLPSNNFAGELSSPGIVTDCQATLEAWKKDKSLQNFMATHNCYCPSPNQRPVCTPLTSPSISLPVPFGLPSSSAQMTRQIFQSFFFPIFNSLAESVGQTMVPALPKTNEQQKALLQRQQEEAKKQVLETWQKYLKNAEEQALREIRERQKAGQKILSQLKMGSGPSANYTVIGPKT